MYICTTLYNSTIGIMALFLKIYYDIPTPYKISYQLYLVSI